MSEVKAKIVNMVMIYNDNCEVLALDKVHPDWGGITFPGGKVQAGESIYESAVREAKEETGLDISALEPCGIVHWAAESGERYLEFLFRTKVYSGELCKPTHEGRCFWISREALQSAPNLSMNFKYYLPMFFEDKYAELFFEWDGKAWDGIPQYK